MNVAEGYLCIVDRIKDIIITGGENVYPKEVEEARRNDAQHSIILASCFWLPASFQWRFR